jgi:hypothetical protein
MKRGAILLVLLLAGGIVVGFASPRDDSPVKPPPTPKAVPVSSAVAIPTCAVAQFTHRGYPKGTKANEIIYDNNAVLSDSYRRVGPKPIEVTVPLRLNPGPHTVRLKVEVDGVITDLSDAIVVDCP